MRNLYPNSMTCIMNYILSEKPTFIKKLCKILRKLIMDSEMPVEIEDFISFCKKNINHKKFSLQNYYKFMNFEQSYGKERTYLRMFHDFVQWFLYKKYPVSLAKSDQC